jgi:hypothetical protein
MVVTSTAMRMVDLRKQTLGVPRWVAYLDRFKATCLPAEVACLRV